MANCATPDKSEDQTIKREIKPDLINDVQYYLTVKYREALKSGDKSFANSCLLSTRLFSANSSNIIDEEQIMARSNSDVAEAAKYFSSIFEQLFICDDALKDNVANEIMAVANQMKEEIRLLLNELKTQYLKLKSHPDPLNTSSIRQAPPISSPRSRMSSEDRSVMGRDTISKLDSHLISHKKSCFYQELYDNLPQETRRDLIDYSINNCDNPFERCRLMMLAITLSNDCVKTYGPKQIHTLIELSEPTNQDKTSNSDKTFQRSTRAIGMCQYAKSMLVLDAIPLMFSLSESQDLDVNIEELLSITFKYYAEICLNTAANEFDLEELPENVEKCLTSVDLMKPTLLEDHIEERVNLSINLIFDRFLQEFSTDPQAIKVLKKVRETVTGEGLETFEPMFQLLSELDLDVEIPESILFSSTRNDLASKKSQSSVATPPPKGRGRPKKAQAISIASPDDDLKRHLVASARKTVFIFNSYVQMFFMQSSQYLKSIRCMLPIDTRNPLAKAIKMELAKHQRRSRQSNSDTASPAKKHKGDNQEPEDGIEMTVTSSSTSRESRLREAYKKLKQEAKDSIGKCEFWFNMTNSSKTGSPGAQSIDRLWKRFNFDTPNIDEMKWIKRIKADLLLFQGSYLEAVQVLQGFMSNDRRDHIKKEDVNDERVLTVPVSSKSTVDVALLRAMMQSIFAYIQLEDNDNALNTIADLLVKIKQTGLAVSAEDSLHDMTFYCIEKREVEEEQDAKRICDCLLMTVPSMVHYCVHMLMDILQCYVSHPTASSDLAIGHAIVLSQASWPRYSAVYERCIDWIRSNKPKSTTPQSISASTKFTYPDFFYFVQDPNILEDFMALLNDGYTLDIRGNQSTSALVGGGGPLSAGASSSRSSGSSTSTRSGKAITTRGVNKSFKEELKVALVAQMKHSCAPVPLDLIIEFIQSPLIPFLLVETQTRSSR